MSTVELDELARARGVDVSNNESAKAAMNDVFFIAHRIAHGDISARVYGDSVSES